MSTASLKAHFTYADYAKLDKDTRFEVMNGQVYIMSANPMPRHQEVAGQLKNTFSERLRGKDFKLFSSPADVCLGGEFASPETIEEWVQPDLAIVCGNARSSGGNLMGTPDFIAEVICPATVKKDCIDKFYRYERAGVREYWLVDPFNEMIEVYVLKNGKYERNGVYFKADRIPVTILHGTAIDGKEIFRLPGFE
ncbi:Uma2 family endonuclease [Heyndrickxia acidiproducens]|uniref:Uma2 family endonuclease n=1 Tax=Heyndrickxia acidiproducens TaxID=1121084 RepID=UPI00035CB649|nr:Uma2 family endonuclease [Heyndrickxia acidiproducens]